MNAEPWRALPLALAAMLLLPACGDDGDDASDGPPPPTELETRTVDVDGVAMTSHLVRIDVDEAGAPVASLDLHYVEAGAAEDQTPVVFLHGAPECWYTWHAQLAALSAERRVIAIDLPGYGPHGNPYLPAGSYEAGFVAEQLLGLLLALGVERFDLVSHDWGSAIASFIAGEHPERVQRFVRAQAPVSTYDPSNTPWWDIMSDPVQGPAAVATLQAIDPVAPIPPEDVLPQEDRPAYETECLTAERFEAWRRYFVDTPYEPMMARMPQLSAATDLPVLLLQADGDSGQPLEYFDDVEQIYPDVRLQVITDSGHFTQIEQPGQVTQAIRDFLMP